MSQVEILSSFARDFSSIAQHFVCTSESSVQRSIHTIFIVTLKLPSYTITDTLTTGCSKESSISCSILTKVPWTLCPGSFSPIQPASDYSWHQDQNFQVKMSLRSCHTFDPNLHAIQSSSSDHSIHRIPAIINHTKNWCGNFQWDTSVQIPEFLSLSLISGFQDLIIQFSRFYPRTNLWHLWNLWSFFWISSSSLPHSFALTLGP